MCGRYTLTNPDALAKRFGVKLMPGLKPRYNIAPGQILPVILEQSPKQLLLAHWGLIPHWAKDETIGYKMINARAESILEKPAYRGLVKTKRCLIPADGFFEWAKAGKKKQPYWLRMKDGSLFSFAGLYDIWQDKKGQDLYSFTIITVPANKLVEKIHDRMPAILTPDQEKAWLSPLEPGQLVETVLKPYATNQMSAEPVSLLVNSPANDQKKVIQSIK